MANTLRFKRGLVSGIPTAALGEPLFTTDTFDLYIGNGTTNTRFQKYIASGATTQILRGDGSLYTFPLAISSPSAGQVLKYNGTSWVNDSDAGITGSGTTNYLPKFTGASTLGNSLVFDDGTNIGLGTTTPNTYANAFVALSKSNASSDVALTIRNSAAPVVGGVQGTIINFINDSGINSALAYIQTRSNDGGSSGQTSMRFATYTGSALTEHMRLTSAGRLLLGSTSDNGLRFQVTGDGYFSGSVGIGTTSLTNYAIRIGKSITGNAASVGIGITSTISSDVTTSASLYYSLPSTQAATFTLTELKHFEAGFLTLGSGSTITNQSGFFAGNTLTQATNNYGFYGNIASGTGRWNLYMNGSASNLLMGNTGIGAAPVYKFDVQGTTNTVAIRAASNTSNDILYYGTSTVTGNTYAFLTAINATGSAMMSLQNNNTVSGNSLIEAVVQSASTGDPYIGFTVNGATNWSIGIDNSDSDKLKIGPVSNPSNTSTALVAHTNGNIGLSTATDAGFKLDVNGTMRVSGASTFGTPYVSTQLINGRGFIFLDDSTRRFMTIGMDSNIATINTDWYSGAGGANPDFQIKTANVQRLLISATGAATFSGSVTAGDNLTISRNQNTFTKATISNTTSGTGSRAELEINSSNGTLVIGKYSATTSTYKTFVANDGTIYNGVNGNLSILNDVSGGSIILTAGASSTAHFTIASTGAATFSSSIQAGTAIAIGTTPDTNKPFKILKNINGTVGINFENTSTGSLAFSAIQMGTDVAGGTKFTNIVYSSSGVAQSGVYYPDGTSIINIGTGGLNFYSQGAPIRMFNGGGNGVLKWEMVNDSFINHYTGTAPTTSATDGYRQYSADVTAGNAAPHFRTENGAVIKLYQETTGVGNAIFSQGGGNSVLDDSTFDGYTLRQIVKALRNQGILA